MDAVNAVRLSLASLSPVAPRVPTAPTINTNVIKTETQQALPVGGGTKEVDLGAVEQQRYAAVQKAAQQIANPYVLGDSSFAMFKDVTGQLIVRFFNKRDGTVTYIPEPKLVDVNRSHGASLNIEA